MKLQWDQIGSSPEDLMGINIMSPERNLRAHKA